MGNCLAQRTRELQPKLNIQEQISKFTKNNGKTEKVKVTPTVVIIEDEGSFAWMESATASAYPTQRPSATLSQISADFEMIALANDSQDNRRNMMIEEELEQAELDLQLNQLS
ncbi:Oidioi.mRNA.OKI2018_I69.XSR.g16803.t1.cds [Oikopleura dioica]|uniref:Oidioi.mRNA.OKI2018_I69.XSR.g16803.t1.cds n=1 Tax=Oikopleura dioica TaxID=34765 RepID=A0ABN7SME5_OIKDI|nr:Oidioi.mRNA.OKI2018_I69.XSR.g16803.t1.cds [Oikopleura dioica]